MWPSVDISVRSVDSWLYLCSVRKWNSVCIVIGLCMLGRFLSDLAYVKQ